MKHFTLGILLILATSFVMAQDADLEFAQQKLTERGEVYFTFPVASNSIMHNLLRELSIDGFEDELVYAYANAQEFENFLTYGIEFTPVYEYYNSSKALTMATTTAEMVNWDRYPTHAVYLEMLDNFVTNYPSLCKLETIGSSENGVLIKCLVISDNVSTDEDEPEFWWSGTMHGDETTGYIMQLRFADYLLSNYGSISQVTNIVNNIEIYINPLANPDGTFAGSPSLVSVSAATRTNVNDTDLNRNFPEISGTATTIDSEIQCMMDYADLHDFVMSANTHGGIELTNYPWDNWTSAENIHPDDNWWQLVCWKYATPAQTNSPSGYFTGEGGVTEGADWYYAYGTRQDYFTYFKNIREVTIELSDVKLLDVSQLNDHWDYNRQAMLDYTEQVLYGFRGVVTDACTGTPLGDVKVEIVGHDQDNSEVYSSAPVGNYHRPIYEGSYDVTFSLTGYQSQIHTVTTTNDNSIRLDIQLIPDGTGTPDFAGAPTLIFEGETVDYTDASTGTITSRNWTFEGGNLGTSTDQNPANILYSTAGTYDVTLEILSNGCTISELKTDYIIVAAAIPVVSDFEADQTSVSQGTTVNFTDLSTNNPDDWSWIFDGGTLGTSTDQNPSIVYNTPGLYTVTLTATNTFGGTTEMKTDYIEVTEADLLMSTGTSTRCSGLFKDSGGDGQYVDDETYTHTIYSSTSGAFVRLSFTEFDLEEDGVDCFDYITIYDGETIGSTEIGTYCNTDYSVIGTNGVVTSTDPSGALTIYFSSDGGVTRDGWVAEISCYSPTDPPVADFTSDVTSTCTGEIQFEDLSMGATEWLWDFGDGNTSTEQDPFYTYTMDGVYTVTLEVTNLYGDDTYFITDMITVDMPDSPITTGDEFCGPADLTLNAIGDGTLNWYDQPTGGNLVTTGTVLSDNFTATTTYYVQSEIDNPVTEYVGAEDNSIGGGNYYTNPPIHGLIFDAEQDITIVSVYMYSGATADKTITLKNSSDETVATATVNVPTGGARVTLDFDVPAGTAYELLGPASPNLYRNSAGGSYPYDVDGVISITGCTASDQAFYYYFYDIEVEHNEPCISARVPVTAMIYDLPTVELGVAQIQCGGTVMLDAGSDMTLYEWNGTPGTQTYEVTTTGNYSVVVENTDGCTATDNVDITINDIPAAVVVSGGGTQCGGDMTLTATNGGDGMIYYQGTTTDGTNTTTASASEIVLASGTYYFRAQSVEGCWGDEGAASVTINAIPDVDAPADVIACGGYILPSLTNGDYFISSGGVDPIAAGTEIVVDQTIYVYAESGTTPNCTNENSFTVTINESPVIDNPADVEICESYILPTLTNGNYFEASGGIDPIIAGVEITLTQTIYVYAETGIIPNCTAENSFIVTINNVIPVDIGDYILGDCGENVTLDAGADYSIYEWEGAVGIETFEATLTGTYTVVVEDANGCTSTDDVDVEIRENPVANVTTTPESALSANDGTASVITTGGTAPYSWEWFDLSTGTTVSGLTNGTYCVTVTDHNNCSVEACENVDTEGVAPAANLSADLTSGCDNLTVQFTDESMNFPTSWEWDFGDGSSTSSDTNPVHTYTVPGIYSVSLTVINDYGNNSTIEADYITLGETPVLSLSMTEETVLGNDGTATVIISGGATPYDIVWSNSADSETIFDLIADDYCVTVTELYGCSETECITVTGVVLNLPVADFTSDETEACGSLTVTFTDLSTNDPTSWEWDFGDGSSTSSDINPIHTYTDPGVYTVSLSVENADGDDYIEFISYITVFEEPILSFDVIPVSGPGMSDGEIIMLITGGEGPFTINWSNNMHDLQLYGLSAGLFSVAVIDANGCMASDVVEVTLLTNVDLVEFEKVEVYPNPTNGRLTITSEYNIEEILIFDSLGRVCFSEEVDNNILEIDTELQPGMYYIKVIGSNNNCLKKLIVK
jgi:PKD repeat protein